MWPSPDAAFRSGAPLVGFRQASAAGGGGLHEVVPHEAILSTAARWDAARRPFFIDEAAPDHRCTVQGEVCRTIRGLEGALAVRSGMRMRQAMASGLLRPCSSATVLALLGHYLDPSSRDDVDALLELYPDATIELTAYDLDVGVIPGRNCLFWEVRDY